MAIKFDNATVVKSNSTDAFFRAWVQFVHDLLITTGGWVDPGDTGQLTIASATHPVATNTKVGYRIYRMADSLQGTAPVYMRIDYGSASANANTPQMWVTFGTGSNGSGTITGATFSNLTVNPGNNSTTATNNYGSADTSRAHLLLFCDTSQSMFMSIERSKDPTTGADTSDGILFAWSDGNGSIGAIRNTQYIVRAGGGQPPQETGISFVLSNQTSSAFSSDTGVGMLLFFKSTARPSLGIIVVNSGDYLAEATVSLSVYGATRVYQLCNISGSNCYMATGAASAALRSNTRVGIRYD